MKLYISITAFIYSTLSISILFILLIQLVNGAKFLNITPLFLLFILFVLSSSPAPKIVTVLLTNMYASL